MKNKFIRAALVSAALALSVESHATTIGFDSLTTDGTGFVSPKTYTESGFLFSTQDPTGGFGSARTGDVNFLYNGHIMTWYYGSTSLFNDNLGTGVTVLSKVNGSTFELNSIDLAALNDYYSFGSGENITFTGNVHGGGTVTQSFQFTDQFSFHTFDFVNFSDLDSVTWGQGFPYHQFDNLVLDAGIVTPPPPPANDVPEPASLALLGLGLAGLGMARRKQTK